MSLIQNNRRSLDKVKQLARSGNWQEAKALIDTLPSTPDTERLRKKIAKQLYISTGEIPAAEDVQVVDSKTTAQMVQDDHKVKRSPSSKIPNYGGLVFVAGVCYLIGGLMFLAGIIQILYGTEAGAFTIGTGIMSIISAEVWRVYRDIARNTAKTNILLESLVNRPE